MDSPGADPGVDSGQADLGEKSRCRSQGNPQGHPRGSEAVLGQIQGKKGEGTQGGSQVGSRGALGVARGGPKRRTGSSFLAELGYKVNFSMSKSLE